MRVERPIRVAVIGGGCASMAAAFELTKPELDSKYAVTVYQMGWRLGGKGASGRGQHGRVEEHGLHLWMGYYENAFRLMRECYAELERDPSRVPIAKWSDAFRPANFNAVTDWSPRGEWLPWKVSFPPSPGLPGDPGAKRWSVPEYLARATSLLRTLIETVDLPKDDAASRRSELFPELAGKGVTAESLASVLAKLTKYGALFGIGASLEALRILEFALGTVEAFPQSALATLLDTVASLLREQLAGLVERDDSARRLWEVVDLILAVIRGSIRFRLAFDPRGFDAIDDYDSREWLLLNGASRDSINSAFIRALYDLAFAYEGGDPRRPKIAAGSALRGAMRAFFAYRGAFFWKMAAGMGDVVFAPLYEVLARRGVRFEFFHKLTEVVPSRAEEAPHVERLELDVQALTVDGGAYRPLRDVRGLPSWPSEPDYEQLVSGETMRREKWDFESQWDSRSAERRTLLVGRDFDLVVLGVGSGVIPYVCRDVARRDERWRRMIENVRSVPTQAFQLWMNRDMRDLGWLDGQVNVSGFVEPFDTWADMSHLAGLEAWPEPPKAIAYFCNVLKDDEGGLAAGDPLEKLDGDPERIRSAAARFIEQQSEIVRDNAIRFMNGDLAVLWPLAHGPPGTFRWDLLRPTPSTAGVASEARFDGQYWTANVRPSDRYSQALPGSTKFRISPLDSGYDNLTIAGDWTNCSLNMGCVEAAVMSGRLAAHAIARAPRLADIVGYDHP